MLKLFTPLKMGNTELKNRFVHSATYEVMARENGEVTETLIKRYSTLAKGGVGLIIPGYMYVHPLGRSYKFQSGIHEDALIPSLRTLVDMIHKEGAQIIFQLAHSGRQTTKNIIGQIPLGPSDKGRDPINFIKPKAMTEPEINETIGAFALAANRSVVAGADGVQLHAAHGYLINQFISPFFNHRTDSWGGSDKGRFRFLKETVRAVKDAVPKGTPVLIKLNTHDHTPQVGVTPSLAVKYAKWLAKLGIDGIEVSCGTVLYSFMNMCRGDVPVDELVQSLPLWKKPLGRLTMNKLAGKYNLEEGYNLEAAQKIKPVLESIPLAVVGGMRTAARMEEALQNGWADLISMSRPLIKEPSLVRKIQEGRKDRVACVSCNRCLAAVQNDMPVHCYNKGFPSS